MYSTTSTVHYTVCCMLPSLFTLFAVQECNSRVFSSTFLLLTSPNDCIQCLRSEAVSLGTIATKLHKWEWVLEWVYLLGLDHMLHVYQSEYFI